MPRFAPAWFAFLVAFCAPAFADAQSGDVPGWADQFPLNDFRQREIPLDEIRYVIPRDRIPAIDAPEFVSAERAAEGGLTATEPVISIEIGGIARAYPLGILMYHEIVNDEIAGTPVAITYCPLCNSALAFDRRLDGRVLDFGVSGTLRNSDLVMYDRQTETLWQQFLGKGLVGEYAGVQLEFVPIRVESFARFRERFPEGAVLAPPRDAGAYGRNPYTRYDSSERPMLFDGALPGGIPALERVVVIGDEAWAFSLLRERRRVELADGTVITWEPGQNSALDTGMIRDGRDVGNVVVQRPGPDGDPVDVVHDVSFAFAFHAFHPEGRIHTLSDP